MKKMRTCLGCVFFLLLTGFSAFSSEYKYKFAICSMFKNEAKFLKEWIEFHRLIGAEHFYLYNNESTDNYLEVLKPYIDKNIVELIDWESTEEHAIFGIDNNLWVPYQIGAFTDCIKNIKNAFA